MSKFSMDFSKLLSQIDSVQTKKNYEKDEALWKLTKDKAGNAAAVIRFLPSKNLDDFPFVRMYKHSFQDPDTKRWYIENSLTTIGGQDMVSTVNKELWNSGIDENKKISSLRKRKLSYITNILVIKDLGNPENNGKVFKYSFGPKIWEKIVQAAKPDEALGEEPISAFDPINGADFLLKMTLNESTKQFNYDSSKFNSKKPLFDGDEDKIEEVMNQLYDIQAEVAQDKFKTEEELEKKFLWVIGQDKPAKPKVKSDTDQELDDLAKLATEKPKAKEKSERKPVPMPAMDMDSDGDGDDAFFKNLMNDD